MNEDWPDRLAAAVRMARKVAVLAVGNPGRGDDAAGPYCADLLKKRLRRPFAKRVLILNGREVPENQTGPLRKFGPDLTVIIDAARGGSAPGTIFLIPRDKIADVGVSTHHVSLHFLVRYLQESIGSRVIVVGIEPDTLEESAPLSREVKSAAVFLADSLSEALASLTRARE